MGGPDPLDYISMYSNVGDPSQGIPPHWHYVSFGLSDLHGDGRVHDFTGPGSPSGFGFELTFRLRKEEGDTAPPTWPAAVMQGLARYVIQSGMFILNEGFNKAFLALNFRNFYAFCAVYFDSFNCSVLYNISRPITSKDKS